MSHRLFELFARMVENLPARAITRVLDLECQMLEADEANHRVDFPEDARAILCFRLFVQTAKLGRPTNSAECAKVFPLEHIEFFKETTSRLVQADELPPTAMNQFDDAFVYPMLRAA